MQVEEDELSSRLIEAHHSSSNLDHVLLEGGFRDVLWLVLLPELNNAHRLLELVWILMFLPVSDTLQKVDSVLPVFGWIELLLFGLLLGFFDGLLLLGSFFLSFFGLFLSVSLSLFPFTLADPLVGWDIKVLLDAINLPFLWLVLLGVHLFELFCFVSSVGHYKNTLLIIKSNFLSL